MTFRKHFTIAAVLVAAGIAPAMADDAPVSTAAVARALGAARPHHVYLIGSLRVTQPWIDVTGASPGDPTAYLTVENFGNAADMLTGGSLTGASSVAVVPADGAPPAEGAALKIPPKGRLALAPGKARLVLQGLAGVTVGSPPVAGVLRFERAGSLPLSFATDHADAIAEDQSTPASEDKPVDLSQ